jgi:hypothetical protein
VLLPLVLLLKRLRHYVVSSIARNESPLGD